MQYVCSAQYGCCLISFLVSSCPGVLLRYCLSDFEMVLFAPIITGITFVFTFLMRSISVVRSLHFRISSATLLVTFLSPEIATSVNIQAPFSLSRVMSSQHLPARKLSPLPSSLWD